MAELATLRILMEWRALEHIPSTGSITYAELATKISADPSLIRRLCWPLVASELLAQPAADTIAHTAASRCFTNDNPQGVRRMVVDYFEEQPVKGECLSVGAGVMV